MPKPKPVTGISCSVCFVTTGRRNLGDDDHPITVVNGYATCRNHLYLVAREGFSIFMLKSAGVKHQT